MLYEISVEGVLQLSVARVNVASVATLKSVAALKTILSTKDYGQ